MTNFGIDVGHGATKGRASTGQQLIFPSLICPAPHRVDLGDYNHSDVVAIDDEPYLVGDAARRFAAPLWSRDKAGDPDTLRLHLIAAAQLGANGPVRLATGLPLSWYGSQRQAFKQALQGQEAKVSLPGRRPVRLWFETVIVLPQGVAAASLVLADAAYEPGPYLVCDIGERTTDFIVVVKRADGSLDFDNTFAGSLELGMHAVSAGVASVLTEQYGVPIKAAQVEREDTIVIQRKRIPLADERRRQRDITAKQIARGLVAALDSQIEQLLGIVAVGGGSSLLADTLSGVTEPPEAQFANVRAYLAAANALSVANAGRISGTR